MYEYALYTWHLYIMQLVKPLTLTISKLLMHEPNHLTPTSQVPPEAQSSNAK